MDQELIKFIEEYLGKGSTEEEIRSVLMKVGGWTPQDLDDAFSAVDPSLNKPVQPPVYIDTKNKRLPQASVIDPKKIEGVVASGPASIIKSSEPVIVPQVVQEKKELLGIYNLFLNTFSVYKENIKNFSIIQFINFVLYLLSYFAYIFLFVYLVVLIMSASSGLLANNLILSIIVSIIVMVLCIWLIWFIYGWPVAATLYLIKNRDKKVGIADSFKATYKKATAVSKTLLLTSIVVALGVYLLIIPSIIFAVWFTFSMFSVVFDDVSEGKALSFSKNLVKGYFYPVLARIISLLLFAFVLDLIISLPLSLVENSIALGIVGSAYLVFIYPFIMIYYSLIYEQLKKIKGTN